MFITVLTYIVGYISIVLFTSFLVMTWIKYKNIKTNNRRCMSDEQKLCSTLMSIFWPLTYIFVPIIYLASTVFDLTASASSNLANFLYKDKS